MAISILIIIFNPVYSQLVTYVPTCYRRCQRYCKACRNLSVLKLPLMVCMAPYLASTSAIKRHIQNDFSVFIRGGGISAPRIKKRNKGCLATRD